jgi:ribonuclease VapC
MFVDASAIVAIVAFESEHLMLSSKLSDADDILTSPLALYEATMGLARIAQNDFDNAVKNVDRFVQETRLEIVSWTGRSASPP